MTDYGRFVPRVSRKGQLGIGAAVLLALGAAGGASAVAATRPSVEMAPTVATPVAKLAQSDGVVTVRGRVAEVYGDRFTIADGTGKAMVAVGREGRGTVTAGTPLTVQGRYDDGQLRASYLVDAGNHVTPVGPEGRPPRGLRGEGPRGDGPPPPPPPGGPDRGGPGAPPPPPPGGPDRGGPGAPPPPPSPCGAAGAPAAGMMPPPPPPAGQAPGAAPAPLPGDAPANR